MLQTLRSAMRISDLRRRIIFTLWMFLVFRVGTHIPVPGIDTTRIEQLFQGGSLLGLLDLFSGGAFKAFSVFAMSITPYINASIIMQLLTVVIPHFERLQKEGVEGRKKLTQYTRYGTVILALIQAYGMSYAMRTAVISPTFGSITLIALSLTAGTAFLMWLGEMITERGIGNGISLIIFAGIVSRLPSGLGSLWAYLTAGTINILNVALLAVVALVVIAAVVWMQEGQRRIPVQYAKRVKGRRYYGGQTTHLPIRVNTAGVIPVIFSTSLLAFPVTIAQFIDHPVAQRIAGLFDFSGWLYVATNAVLIILFTYFYTAIQFNPMNVANDLKKWGGFIPGIRPGRPTAEYINKVLNRVTLAGALFLAFIAAVLPTLVQNLTGIGAVYFGGTALLIVVGVALETMKQIETHLVMRHYQGFLK
ncbi:MAG TPA: preprotein translocase subunit SecY [Clostridiales bacterium]|nr:preprotein translocase subunit SecY [Clostridiales bacterium]